MKISGENIMRWSQLKMRQVVQQWFFMMSRKGHQMSTQMRSQT